MTFCLPNNSIDSLKFGRILQRSRVEIFSSSKVDKNATTADRRGDYRISLETDEDGREFRSI